MSKVAILLTVYNRKEITLDALRLLHKIVQKYAKFSFDIFMVDDGCTDGTAEAVKLKYPKVYIHRGDGHLYWSGGMRKAWEIAIETADYDYFIWFNDDAMLFDDALDELFRPIEEFGHNIIISGAFVDDDGCTSYGGRDEKGKILSPNNQLQNVYLMNGNWVLVPKQVVEKIGLIDSVYKHSLGDWDYGCRARKAGIKILLTKKYVGKTNRHDDIPVPYNTHFFLWKRLKYFFHCKYNPYYEFIYVKRYYSLCTAIKIYFMKCLCVIYPALYKTKF